MNEYTYLFHLYSVNPIYFVCFTTATITASAILFQGFNTDNSVNVVSLICGFVIIFAGVYLLDSIARGAGANGANEHGRRRDEEIYDEDEELLMSEATLLENEESVGMTEFNGHHQQEEGRRSRSWKTFLILYKFWWSPALSLSPFSL